MLITFKLNKFLQNIGISSY